MHPTEQLRKEVEPNEDFQEFPSREKKVKFDPTKQTRVRVSNTHPFYKTFRAIEMQLHLSCITHHCEDKDTPLLWKCVEEEHEITLTLNQLVKEPYCRKCKRKELAPLPLKERRKRR